MKFTPTSELNSLESGDKWCNSLDEVEEFKSFILSSSAYKLTKESIVKKVELNFENMD